MPATRMTTGTGPMITDTGPSGLITASQAAGDTGSPVTALRVGRSRHGLPTYAPISLVGMRQLISAALVVASAAQTKPRPDCPERGCRDAAGGNGYNPKPRG